MAQRAVGHTKKELEAIQEQRKKAVLESIAELASVSAACKATEVPRSTFYQWIQDDEEFRKAYRKAARQGLKALEDEAIRRAYKGVRKPVYQGGKLVGHERRYSDTLLMFMLKALAPNKYKERVANEQTGKDGGPIQNEYKVNVNFNDFTKKDEPGSGK